MIDVLKNVCLYIVIGILIHLLNISLNSPFLISFLEKNIITFLVALLAINTTTMSIIMVKLRELKDAYSISFDHTVKSLKFSLYEQVFLIPLSILVLTIKESTVIAKIVPSSEFVCGTLLVTIFAYAIHILYDTANGIFIIITTENKK